jgi:hypothetical protein
VADFEKYLGREVLAERRDLVKNSASKKRKKEKREWKTQ